MLDAAAVADEDDVGREDVEQALLETARADVLAFTAFPQEVWRQIWSNNPSERLNREIRRRYLGLDVLARCRLRPVTDTGDTSEEVTAQTTIPALSA